jgi:hypothetical protein
VPAHRWPGTPLQTASKAAGPLALPLCGGRCACSSASVLLAHAGHRHVRLSHSTTCTGRLRAMWVAARCRLMVNQPEIVICESNAGICCACERVLTLFDQALCDACDGSCRYVRSRCCCRHASIKRSEHYASTSINGRWRKRSQNAAGVQHSVRVSPPPRSSVAQAAVLKRCRRDTPHHTTHEQARNKQARQTCAHTHTYTHTQHSRPRAQPHQRHQSTCTTHAGHGWLHLP